MPDPFYVTTPIYYVNARPHLGHAYTTIVADITARFNTMRQADTFFLTGTDEHGDKVVRAAKKENLSPKKYADNISGLFKNLWPELNIRYSHFIRTTDPSHQEVVEHILQKIYDAGDIYFSKYSGLYCFGCERFYAERELVDGRCPDHETEPEMIEESNYFFKMSRYQEWLIDHIQKHPDFIRPERYRKEVLSFLREPLEDLSISRPKSRLKWGITLPFDKDHVTYVWFDALLNYVSALGYPDGDLFKKYWPHAHHIIAKDILKPHAIYWPTMLKAAGIPLFKHLNVSGYWNVEQSKMSKSLGNVIEPRALKDKYGLDALRFFLMREMVFGLDSGFSEDAFVQRINSDLANDLGNLFSRVITMTHKYFKGIVPEVDVTGKQSSLSLNKEASKAIHQYEDCMESFQFHKAITAVWKLISQMNKYIDVNEPWVLAKEKTAKPQLEAVIYNLLEGLRIVAGLIYPIMPETSDKMRKHLGIEIPAENLPTWYHIDALKKWGSLTAGTQLPKSLALFPRIELPKSNAESRDNTDAEIPAKPLKQEITIEDIGKIDLRVATILSAERIPKAKKLLKLEVDAGEKKNRTIVAGISESYTPDELVGRQVIIVANLKPAKLMGVMSNGMLLAAIDGDSAVTATLEKKVKPGSPLQ